MAKDGTFERNKADADRHIKDKADKAAKEPLPDRAHEGRIKVDKNVSVGGTVEGGNVGVNVKIGFP